LCLLAAVFAFEAKLAGYSSRTSTSYGQISATKLQPADAPKLIAQALSAPSVLQHRPAEPIFVLAVALLAVLVPLSLNGVVCDGFKLQVSSGLSSHLFRRPPPQF
jgi:hypothetical protein